MKSKMKNTDWPARLIGLALACALGVTLIVPAFAAEQTELETAAEFVREQGIMVGDGAGDMNLDAGLTRSELAALLTRLRNGEKALMANTDYYSRGCKFVDVPEWARLYVGYCVRNNLVVGYDKLHYGGSDPVNPAAACTVILRACGKADEEGSAWIYSTACGYAVSLGWLDKVTAAASTITRGEMALLIYRAMTDGVGCLTNGKPVSEENVLELLHEIEKDWPSGTVWGPHTLAGTNKNEIPGTVSGRVMDLYWVNRVYGCSGYANMVSTLVFGDKTNPARQVKDLSQIRPGDILFLVRNDTGEIWHVMVALESPNAMNALHYTDGNHGHIVYWPEADSPYSRENLNCYLGEGRTYRLEAWTRYPVTIPFTGASANVWEP